MTWSEVHGRIHVAVLRDEACDAALRRHPSSRTDVAGFRPTFKRLDVIKRRRTGLVYVL